MRRAPCLSGCGVLLSDMSETGRKGGRGSLLVTMGCAGFDPCYPGVFSQSEKIADLHLRKTIQKDSLTMLRDPTVARRESWRFTLRITRVRQRVGGRVVLRDERQGETRKKEQGKIRQKARLQNLSEEHKRNRRLWVEAKVG